MKVLHSKLYKLRFQNYGKFQLRVPGLSAPSRATWSVGLES